MTIEADKQVLIGHADLAINNIYLFNDQGERVVPQGRQGIYLCLQTPKREAEKQEPVAWMLACAMDDFKKGHIVEVSREKEEPDDIPLYTHPPKREAEKQEPIGEAYLCDKCQTPFDMDWLCPSCGHNMATKEPVYTHPPKREWVGLTEEELSDLDRAFGIWSDQSGHGVVKYYQAIEAKLKEKNFT